MHGLTGRKQTPEHIAKRRALLLNEFPPERRAAISEQAKKKWDDGTFRLARRAIGDRRIINGVECEFTQGAKFQFWKRLPPKPKACANPDCSKLVTTRRAKFCCRKCQLKSDTTRLYYKAKYRSNPQDMLARRIRNRIRKMVGRNRAGKSTLEILGCDWQSFKTHIESQFTARMSWQNYGKWHIDHIRPCASFDLTNEIELKRCFHFSNLRPLWAKDNLEKSDKIVPFQPQLFHLFSLSDKSERVPVPVPQATIEVHWAAKVMRYEESTTP